MTSDQMRKIARRVGILNMQRRAIEEELKAWKDMLAKHVKTFPVSTSASGNSQHVLDGVDGFTCKVYEKTQLYASQEKARELLHPNTFAAIFKPSTFDVVDVRPTKATEALILEVLLDELKAA